MTTPESLYLTNPRGKLHIRVCAHLQDTEDPPEATAEQRAENEVCHWCAPEVAGTGRRYFTDLDMALREIGHVRTSATTFIHEGLAGVEYDSVWLPSSASYVALGLDGPAVAWVGVGSLTVKGQPPVAFPWYSPEVSTPRVTKEEVRGELCMTHFVEMSLTGRCEQCE